MRSSRSVRSLTISPRLNLDSLDSDPDGPGPLKPDGRYRLSELTSRLPQIDIAPKDKPIKAHVFADVVFGFLDYVDVDPKRTNTPHGGDPYIVRAQTDLVGAFNIENVSVLGGRSLSVAAFVNINVVSSVMAWLLMKPRGCQEAG